MSVIFLVVHLSFHQIQIFIWVRKVWTFDFKCKLALWWVAWEVYSKQN